METDGWTDMEGKNIIPQHYCMVGYTTEGNENCFSFTQYTYLTQSTYLQGILKMHVRAYELGHTKWINRFSSKFQKKMGQVGGIYLLFFQFSWITLIKAKQGNRQYWLWKRQQTFCYYSFYIKRWFPIQPVQYFYWISSKGTFNHSTILV